jgi:hypothetical protein
VEYIYSDTQFIFLVIRECESGVVDRQMYEQICMQVIGRQRDSETQVQEINSVSG